MAFQVSPGVLVQERDLTSIIPAVSTSIGAVAGQFTKDFILIEIVNYWLLFLIVFLGGQLGNFLNLKIFPTRMLALITSALVIFVAIRIGLKLFV